jgi:hypothetical protein
MANDRKITIEVKHSIDFGQGRGRSSSSADNISSRLENFNKITEELGKTLRAGQDSSEAVTQTLADKIAGLNVALSAMNKNTNESFGNAGFAKMQQALGQYEVMSQKYDFSTPAQRTARDLYSSLNQKGIKNAEDYTNIQGEAARETGKFVAAMKQANLEANNKGSDKYNLFNVAELLIAAGARAATTYFAVGAGYSQSLIGAAPSQYAGLQVGADIAQRTAISNAVQATLPALGFLAGELPGAAIGYAASIPFSMYQQMTNVAEQQRLSIQMQGALVNLFGGQSGSSLIPGLGAYHGIYLQDSDKVYGSSFLANVVGKGLPTGAAVSLAMASKRYGGSLSSSSSIIPFLSGYSAETGDDSGSLANTIMYLAATSGKSPSDVLSMLGGVGAFTGQTAGQVAPLISQLTSSSTLRSFGAASSFVANTAGYGSAFQQTAAAYQMGGFQQQIAENVLGHAFGLNIPGVMGGNQRDIDQFKSWVNEENKRGNIAGVGVGTILSQIVAGGTQAANSIINSAPGTGQSYSGQTVSQSQVSQNLPDAYKNAVRDATINASGKTTILVRNPEVKGFWGATSAFFNSI